jgi:hypothetical protein
MGVNFCWTLPLIGSEVYMYTVGRGRELMTVILLEATSYVHIKKLIHPSVYVHSPRCDVSGGGRGGRGSASVLLLLLDLAL